MANRPENAQEKQFRSDVVAISQIYGPVVEGNPMIDKGRIQYHHVVGKSYKQNKTHIGYYFLLPLPWSLHDIDSNDQLNVTHFRKRFVAAHGTQRELYFKMIEMMKFEGMALPPTTVLAAIADTSY